MFDWDFPEWCQFLFEPMRYKAAHGGRGSTKSWSFARALIYCCAFAEPGKAERILCAREIQKSIKDSVHKLLCDQIEAMGLSAEFEIQNNSIRHANGSEFLFEGLRSNVTKIKSLEGLTKVWVEEAEKVSKESWAVLIPTLRKTGSEIWVTFNPDEETDPTSIMFHVESLLKKENAIIVEVNFDSNPWFPGSEMEKEKNYLYRVDPDAAAHVWGGKFRKASKAQILHGKYSIDSFEPMPGWLGPYFGADWGFSQDPTTLVKCWYDPKARTLYIEYEAYGIGVETQNIATMFKKVPHALIMARKGDQIVPAPQQYIIRADNARPETINYVCNYGFNVVPCQKWSGCVEDGITWLRSLELIVIHQRCTHAEFEARFYKYKVDPVTGDVLPIIVDKHNHVWDAVRYAMEEFILQTQDAVIEAVAEMPQMAPELDDLEDGPAWLTA